MKLIYTRHEERALSSPLYEGPVEFGLEVEVPEDTDWGLAQSLGFEEKEAYAKARAKQEAEAQAKWDAEFGSGRKEAIAKAQTKKDSKEVQSQAQPS
jgi:hypothetical protein